MTIGALYVQAMGTFLAAGALAFVLAVVMGFLTELVRFLAGRVAAMILGTLFMLCAVGAFLVLVDWGLRAYGL